MTQNTLQNTAQCTSPHRTETLQNLAPGAQLGGWRLRRKEGLPEIEGSAYIFDHTNSGAQLLYLQNDDNNKSFSIAFKTPPADNSGVFHILEHSVLCGSRKFPVKEPFVNLLKTSMQTFLNAMTFPDKTVYPVASTNEKDLFNLVDVYLDAVFHPNIYLKPEIFKQEGWHFETAEASFKEAEGGNAEKQLVFNGVVYNEMKGVLSDANNVLFNELFASLFPDSCYRFESGGVPMHITDLSYEQFLEEHRAHYRPSNCYITLYGNLNILNALEFLSTNYLDPVNEEIKAFDSARQEEGKTCLCARNIETQCAVHPEKRTRTFNTAKENACCALGYVIGSFDERTKMIAADILFDALAGSNVAPLKRALLDADLADDISIYPVDSLLQPVAVVHLKGIHEKAADRLQEVFEQEVGRIAKAGIDHALIEASLSRAEFTMREKEFGMPDGVALSISSLAGWLYDDEAPTEYLRYEDAFKFLRTELEKGYFEKLLRALFLENEHFALAEVIAVSEPDTNEALKIQNIEKNFTETDYLRIESELAKLRCAQTAPDSAENLACLRQLQLDEIEPAPQEPAYRIESYGKARVLRHDARTPGIVYAYRYFDLAKLSFDDIGYAGILTLLLGKLGTAHRSAEELDTLVNAKLGNFSCFTESYVRENSKACCTPAPRRTDEIQNDDLQVQLVVSASALSENIDHLASLVREILCETQFADAKKIHDILSQQRLGMEQAFCSAGHSAAMARLSSYYRKSAVLHDAMRGIGFYRFLKDILANYDDRFEELCERLALLCEKIFCDDNCLVSFSGSDEELAQYWKAQPSFGRIRNETQCDLYTEIPLPVKRNEAFVIPGDVCYVAQGYSWNKESEERYSGEWKVLCQAISFDYLWNEVRVQGGAYGCGIQLKRAGNFRLYSFRDPHLDETLARFEALPKWLRAFNPDKRQWEGYIISSLAAFDTPLKTRRLIRSQDAAFFAEQTPELRMQTRKEIFEADVQAAQILADIIENALEQKAICVFASREIIEKSHTELEMVKLLED